MGEVTVRLKVNTQSTSNITVGNRIASPENIAYKVMMTRKTSRIVPTLSFVGSCADDISNDNDIFVDENGIVQSNTINYEEGTVFQIRLENKVANSVGVSSDVSLKVPMPSDVGFVVEALKESSNDFILDESEPNLWYI